MTTNKKWASIYSNDDFIYVGTCSGMRRTALDGLGMSFFLPAVPQPVELGEALQNALLVSRTLTGDDLAKFFELANVENTYEDWVSALIQKFGYTTRGALFKNMRCCHVEKSNGVITIRPSFHEKLEAWSGKNIEMTDHVKIEETASFQHIGNAAFLALSRCIDR